MKNTNNSVKKHQSYWVLLLALLFCGSASAKVNHYVGASAQIGEWSLLPSQSDYSGSLGVAGGLGFQYELQAGRNISPVRFLFDVGVTASGGMTSYLNNSKDKTVKLERQMDLDGKPFDYVYDIRDRKDKYSNIALQIPLMVGIQYKRFYALAGVKVYANVLTKAHTTAIVSTHASYPYPEAKLPDLTGMQMYQFFDDQEMKSDVKTHLNLDIDASLEVGARLGEVHYDKGFDVPKSKLEYRLAAFIDYGLFDVHTKGTVADIATPDRYDINPASENYIYNTRTMLDNMTFNDVMSTNNFASMVRNMVVGVKFTVLFQLPEQQKCVLCKDAYRSSVRTYTGSRIGMNYEE